MYDSILIRISSSLTYSAYVLGLGPAHVIKTKEIVQDGCKIKALVWKTMTQRVYFSLGGVENVTTSCL